MNPYISTECMFYEIIKKLTKKIFRHVSRKFVLQKKKYISMNRVEGNHYMEPFVYFWNSNA